MGRTPAGPPAWGRGRPPAELPAGLPVEPRPAALRQPTTPPPNTPLRPMPTHKPTEPERAGQTFPCAGGPATGACQQWARGEPRCRLRRAEVECPPRGASEWRRSPASIDSSAKHGSWKPAAASRCRPRAISPAASSTDRSGESSSRPLGGLEQPLQKACLRGFRSSPFWLECLSCEAGKVHQTAPIGQFPQSLFRGGRPAGLLPSRNHPCPCLPVQSMHPARSFFVTSSPSGFWCLMAPWARWCMPSRSTNRVSAVRCFAIIRAT